MNLEHIKARAQQTADGEGKAMAVLNMCMAGAPMYVIRTFEPSMAGSSRHIATLWPNPDPDA